METIQMLNDVISSVGFPIVACIFLYKQNCNIIESHKGEIDTLKDVINNNTLSVTKMYEKLDALIDILGKGVSENENK